MTVDKILTWILRLTAASALGAILAMILGEWMAMVYCVCALAASQVAMLIVIAIKP